MSDPAPKKNAKPNTNGRGTVFDIKRPGKAPVQSTSRPVIVGHKSVVRDPFTTGKTEASHPTPAKRVDIEPPTAADSAATPELAAVAAELTTQPEPKPPVPEPPVAHEEPEPVSEPEGKSDPVPKVEKTDEQMVAAKDYVPGPDTPLLPPEPPVKEQPPLSPEMKRQLDAVAHESTPAPEPEGVVVSGDHGPLSFLKVLLWFVAVIVLVVVIGDVLLDAGAITTSVSIPYTHFIK